MLIEGPRSIPAQVPFQFVNDDIVHHTQGFAFPITNNIDSHTTNRKPLRLGDTGTWSPIQTLGGLHQLLARTKELHFDCILIHSQHSRQFFH